MDMKLLNPDWIVKHELELVRVFPKRWTHRANISQADILNGLSKCNIRVNGYEDLSHVIQRLVDLGIVEVNGSMLKRGELKDRRGYLHIDRHTDMSMRLTIKLHNLLTWLLKKMGKL